MSQGDHKSANAVCPYWEGKDAHSIYCEGTVEGSRLRLSFSIPTEKLEYCRRFCDSDRWKDCLIAAMLEAKWTRFFEEEN